MMIDSLDMNDEDRTRIARECQRCEESRVVITHGTEMMVETAAILPFRLPRPCRPACLWR
jgi:L-asparaginase